MTDISLPSAAECDRLLAECLRGDRFRLRRAWQRLSGKPDAGALAHWERQVAASRAKREARKLALPVPVFDDRLPVSARRDEIRELIAGNQVVIVAGETGSGKTTQLPKICLALGRGVDGFIGHTQPRRLAARAVATRVAQELGTTLGGTVGYKVRFNDQVGEQSLVKLMTDGILLAEIAHDRFLEKYDTIIIDEAHERSLNIDFLLGYLKRILPKRPDLKVIITSATIDHLRFARHFADARGNPAPVIEVSGRTWPVETVWRPTADDDESRVLDLPKAVHKVYEEILARERRGEQPPGGDVLVFLTGEREIREVHQHLRRALKGVDILPLYARLGAAEQNRVFAPHGGRRIVLATNVAETSITVPGIRYVIDPGLVRISRYSARSRVQRLPIEAVSRASADQRKGRCGRVEAGVCYRLYDEADYLSRPEYTDPEVLRTNLASVILQMQYLGLGAIDEFPFLEPPDRRFVQDGWRLLEELNAVDTQKRLTATGRQLATLPVDPRLGRMLLEAARTGALAEVLLIVAGLAVQDPRERPHDRQQAADEAHAAFADRDSDFLWFVNCWRAFEAARQELSNGELRRWCEQRFLSFLRMREWRETHHQLRLQCEALGLREGDGPADFVAVHRALLSGLLSQVFQREEGREDRGYLGTRNRRFVLWPGSALAKKGTGWGVCAEMVETQRTYARTVARVQPGWIEGQAQHLVRREYFDARWDAARGMVMAREQVSLLGLVLHPGRDVHYGPIDPVTSRELFIRGALVQGDWETDLPFAAHNARLREEVGTLEEKARRRDILADEDALFRWFDARVPADVFSARKCEHWYRDAARRDPALLCLGRAELLAREPAEITPELFPDRAPVAGAQLPVHYHFAPGEEDDGASVEVPVTVLNQVAAVQLDWLVPGLLREQCMALLKSLPRETRRHFVPVPDTVDAILPALRPGERPLAEALAAILRQRSGQPVSAADFNSAALPPHLRANVRVVDERGALLAQGRDLPRLQQELGAVAVAARARTRRRDIERDDIRDATFAAIPEMVEEVRGSLTLRSFPALVDEGDHCAVRLFDDEGAARIAHRRGLRRLVLLHGAAVIRPMRKGLPALNEMTVRYRTLGTADEFLDDLWLAIADAAILGDDADRVRDGASFAAQWDARRGDLHTRAARVAKGVGEALARWREAEDRLFALPAVYAAAKADIRAQLDALVFPHFVAEIPAEWLPELPRYLQAVLVRLEKLPGQPEKDREWTRELEALRADLGALAARCAADGRRPPDLERYRWLIEEYRVSLFAQTLRTRVPVSAQRLARLRERIS